MNDDFSHATTNVTHEERDWIKRHAAAWIQMAAERGWESKEFFEELEGGFEMAFKRGKKIGQEETRSD